MRHALHGILEPIPEDCDSHVLILFVSIWSSKQHVEVGVHEIGIGDGDISWALENRHQAQFCIEGCEMVHPHTARIRKDMHGITLSHSIHLEVVQYHIANTTQNNAFAWWWWWWRSKSKSHPIHPQVANQFPDCSNNTNSTGQDIHSLFVYLMKHVRSNLEYRIVLELTIFWFYSMQQLEQQYLWLWHCSHGHLWWLHCGSTACPWEQWSYHERRLSRHHQLLSLSLSHHPS